MSDVTVCDGLLFHGNLTDFMLMDAELQVLHRYVAGIVEVTRPPQPVVVSFYHADVEAAVRTVCDERGSAWEA